MRLVVGASVLIGELLRAAGRARLADARLELFMPESVWNEVLHELPRRITAFAARRAIREAEASTLSRLCLEAIEANAVVIQEAVYAALEEEARARSLRDPSDWPLVACALLLEAAIWTRDGDFLGTGVATWTTETLSAWLARHPA